MKNSLSDSAGLHETAIELRDEIVDLLETVDLHVALFVLVDVFADAVAQSTDDVPDHDYVSQIWAAFVLIYLKKCNENTATQTQTH